MSSELLTHQFFAPLVGSVLHTEADGSIVDLLLDDVTPLPSPHGNAGTVTTALPGRQEPFSLLFRGSLDRLLPQGTYRMTHDSLAEPLDIFIVPVAREADGYVYQAIFG